MIVYSIEGHKPWLSSGMREGPGYSGSIQAHNPPIVAHVREAKTPRKKQVEKMASQPLRIGVIGVGFGSRIQPPGFLSEGLEVVAVCASRQERAESVAREFGIPHAYADYREMLRLPGLDAVSIVTPRHLHHPMAMAGLAAGKHVLCEKPFAMDQGERGRCGARPRRAG